MEDFRYTPINHDEKIEHFGAILASHLQMTPD